MFITRIKRILDKITLWFSPKNLARVLKVFCYILYLYIRQDRKILTTFQTSRARCICRKKLLVKKKKRIK